MKEVSQKFSQQTSLERGGSDFVQQFTEHIMDWRSKGAEIDIAHQVVQNVALAGQLSKNGYTYEIEALKKAVPLYEGKPVFLDHAVNASRPMERSARDLIGTVVNVRFEDDRVRGDIKVLDTESGRTFLTLAESEHQAVGMSHVVLAERSEDRKRVVKIHDVISVDAVVFPATTTNLSENSQTLDRDGNQQDVVQATLLGSYEMRLQQVDERLVTQFSQMGFEDYSDVKRLGLFDDYVVATAHHLSEEKILVLAWREVEKQIELAAAFMEIDAAELDEGTWRERDDLPRFDDASIDTDEIDDGEEPDTEMERFQLISQVEQLRGELGRLQQQLVRSEMASKQHQVKLQVCDQLEEVGLPQEAVSEVFREQLVQLQDRETRKRLIEERLQLWKKAKRGVPYSVNRLSESETELSEEDEFLKALRA